MAEIEQLLDRTLVLVAHPDDEAVGCGVLLQRMRRPGVIFLTDGAPEDQYFWGKFGSRETYSQVRENEARVALAAVGVEQVEIIRSVTDQRLYTMLQHANDYLSEAIQRLQPTALLTLAYEGGHPDHDSCSFLSAQLGRRFSLPVWEMPLYFRRDDGRIIAQTEFLKPGPEQVTVTPSEVELARKRAMLEAYASQGEVLKQFTDAIEHFRPQVRYDYGCRPHEGTLNYDAWGWSMRGEQVCEAVRQFEGSKGEAA